MSRILRIGTRGSKLALVQTHWVIGELQRADPGTKFDLVTVRTDGDRSADAGRPFGTGVGVFVREIERALVADEVDIAVHSMKDVPTELASGTILAGMPPRVDARDVIITRHGVALEELPVGSRVGTSSARRIAQLLRVRPDLVPVQIRGNVDTRLRKLELAVDDMAAILLAAAGLTRLGLSEKATQLLPLESFPPPAGQGILAIQTRSDDTEARDTASRLDDADTRAACIAERAFIAELGAGCKTPLGAYAVAADGIVKLTAAVYSKDGNEEIRGEESGPSADAIDLGRRLAERLGDEGARRLVEATREQAN